jgi:WD40 repeat protein
VIETGDNGFMYAVAFHPDGMHLWSGSREGVRRWRVADGQEVGNRMPMDVTDISVSRDGKWIVCGNLQGASVWDAKTYEKAIKVDGAEYIKMVDISPDSASFATCIAGTYRTTASIWNIITGERLVCLEHGGVMAGIEFSPNGEHLATAVGDHSIRVFDCTNGDQLITIKADIHSWAPNTLAWSNDGQQIFASSNDCKIMSFDVSTGSQLAESQVDDDSEVLSIALAANGKFLAVFTERSISFWDTSTLAQIGSAIEATEADRVRSIAISPDCSYLATGGTFGSITIRHLGDILPNSYGPFHVSIRVFTVLACRFPLDTLP